MGGCKLLSSNQEVEVSPMVPRVILTALLLAAAFSQSTTSQEISGLVQDATGSVVPNATINVKNNETGFVRTTQTNESGLYVVSNLPIGTYEISAETSGFKKFVTTGVVLNVNSKVSVNVKLEVGNVVDKIEVKADAAQL